MADFIPKGDPNLIPWVTNFLTLVTATPTAYGLVAGDATALAAKQTAWNSAYAAHITAKAAAESATTAKDAARHDLVESIRSAARRIQATPAVTDTQRASLGLTVPDTTPTPSGPPTTKPVFAVDTSERLRHTIKFKDEARGGRGKPDHVRGVEIWHKIGGPAPVSAADLDFVALDTASPYVSDFALTDGGKTVYYMLRWLGNDGVPGPWSDMIETTVVG